MQSAFFVLLAFLTTSAFAQDSCQSCQEGVGNLAKYLLTEPELRKVEALLKAEVCPQVGPDNQSGCEAGVDAWWAKIADAIFNWPNTGPAICQGLGLCSRRALIKQVL